MLKKYFNDLISLVTRLTHFPTQFVLFLCVGVLNTIVGYFLYAFFVFLGFNYIFAPLCSTVLGVLFNFQTIGRIVFDNHNPYLIVRFFGVYLLVYLCNVAGLWALGLIGLDNMYISGAVLAFPLALMSFILNKKLVFNGRKNEKNFHNIQRV